MLPPWDCRRVCDGLELGGELAGDAQDWGDLVPGDTIPERNVVLVAGDRVVTGQCRQGEYLNMEQTVWDTDYTNQHMLFTSCTDIQVGDTGSTMVGYDCINGSAFARAEVPAVSNLTDLQEFMMIYGYQNKLDPTNTTFPFDIDIIILKSAKLKVNQSFIMKITGPLSTVRNCDNVQANIS